MILRRALALVLVTVVGVVAVQQLAGMTRNEDDVRVPGSVSEIVIGVDTRGMDHDLAAEALWAACHPMVAFADVVSPLTRLDGEDEHYAVRVTPALGENDRRRLRGCLEDGTVDRVWGSAVSITPITE